MGVISQRETNCANSPCAFCKGYEIQLNSLVKLARCMENFIYQNYSRMSKPVRRTSFYQEMGSILMVHSNMVLTSDSFARCLETIGRSRTLIEQMENEFSEFVKTMLLEPIEKCRLVQVSKIKRAYNEIEIFSRINSKENVQLHKRLHNLVRQQNVILNRLTDVIFPIMMFQRQLYQYSLDYIEALEDDMDHKKCTKDCNEKDLKCCIKSHHETNGKLVDHRVEVQTLKQSHKKPEPKNINYISKGDT